MKVNPFRDRIKTANSRLKELQNQSLTLQKGSGFLKKIQNDLDLQNLVENKNTNKPNINETLKKYNELNFSSSAFKITNTDSKTSVMGNVINEKREMINKKNIQIKNDINKETVALENINSTSVIKENSIQTVKNVISTLKNNSTKSMLSQANLNPDKLVNMLG